MDDLTPNDLSHLSDEEFNALCPQGYHALGPEPPTAIEIIDLSIEIDDAGLGIVEFARAALERWGHA